MTERVTVVGSPGPIGGARVETWATMRLWAQRGVQVTCLPTSPLRDDWQSRMEAVGIKVLPVAVGNRVIADSITDPLAVAFCNLSFVAASPHISAKLIWVGCHNYSFPVELKTRPFDAYVFQSSFQMDVLAEQHRKHGIAESRRYLIRGAFNVDEYWAEPRRRATDEPLVIGRISRPHPHKFTSDIWERFARIRDSLPCPTRFRVMGWTRAGTHYHTGNPPDWVECLAPGAESTQDFLAKCHVLCQFGDVTENWPRVGLEAMAAGVPLVVDNRGGWGEMIEQEQSGLLAEDAFIMAAHIRELAINDAHRLKIAHAAQKRVKELANPDIIWSGWMQVFEEVVK